MNQEMSQLPVMVENHNFLVTFKAFEESFCQEIIDLYESDPNKWEGRTLHHSGELMTGYAKDSTDLGIEDEGEWSPIFQKIHPVILSCFNTYIQASPALKIAKLTASGYKIQAYDKGKGHFKWHADSMGKESIRRVFAMITYLNDVKEGGETEFHHQGIKLKPKAGYLVLFPTAWNYLHCGHIPVSGKKYIISSFVEIEEFPDKPIEGLD